MEHDSRPWGEYFVLDDQPTHKVKRIVVKAGGQLSYQYHHHRSEVWTVITGRATVTIDDVTKSYNAGDTIFIPLRAKHRIENIGSDELMFIEVQLGTYFGEDDIVRIEDKYNRS